MAVDRIRRATADDIEVLVRGRVRMFQEMAAVAGEALEAAIADRIHDESAQEFARAWETEHFGWVVESTAGEGEVVVASAMVTLQPWLPHPRYPSGTRPYLHSMFTEPDHRGRGLAGLLTETTAVWSRERGYTNFVLHASDAGRPVYQRLGFVDAGELILPLA